MADKPENVLAAVEIGSSKIVCAMAEPLDKDHFRLIAFAEAQSAGMSAGNIVDMTKLTDQLRLVAKEVTSGDVPDLDVVVSGVAGDFIQSENQNSMVVCRHETITQADVEKLISELKQIALPSSMRYLDVYPQEYIIDKHLTTPSPIGLAGSRLEACLHVVTVQATACQNLKRALQKSGMTLNSEHILFNPIAAAEAVLTPEEKQLGVLFIDIGASLTSVCVYKNNAVRFSRIYPKGGDDLTNAISIQTHLSSMDAERLKRDIGMVDFRSLQDSDQTRTLPEYSGLTNTPRVISTSSLSAIMEEPVDEIFNQIYRDLKGGGLRGCFNSGIVLTGGSSWLPGIDRRAQSIFSQHLAGRDLTVRMGYPFVLEDGLKFCLPGALTMQDVTSQRAGFSKPEYSTIMGYLNAQNQKFWEKPYSQEKTGLLRVFFSSMKRFFVGNF